MNPVDNLPLQSNEPGGNEPKLRYPTCHPDPMSLVEMNPDYDTLPATPSQ